MYDVVVVVVVDDDNDDDDDDDDDGDGDGEGDDGGDDDDNDDDDVDDDDEDNDDDNRNFIEASRSVCVAVDDGRELCVPVLLDGEESIMEFVDLPYSGVSSCKLAL